VGIRQSIQQAGFANVRSATKSDFRSLISGKILRSRCALDKSGGTDFHDEIARKIERGSAALTNKVESLIAILTGLPP